MKEMFEASVDGEAYDMDRWGQYFKPAGMSQNTGDPNKKYTPPTASTPAPAAAPAPVAAAAPAPTPTPEAAPATAEAAPADDGANRAQDILAMIRSRNGNS
jgi:cell division septation protein DedD